MWQYLALPRFVLELFALPVAVWNYLVSQVVFGFVLTLPESI